MSPISDSTRVRPEASRPIEIQIMGSGFLDILAARDFSLTGVGLWVPHRFAGCDIESEVELVVTLPDAKSLLTMGSIRHRTQLDRVEQLFGVKFTVLSDAQRQVIRNYIEACCEKQIVRSSYGGARPRVDFPMLARLYLDGQLMLDELISRRLKLAEINDGFAQMARGELVRGVIELAH